MRMIIAVTQAQVVITGLKVIVVATASTNTSAHTPRPRRRVTKSHLWILTSLAVFIMVLRIHILGRNAVLTQQISNSIKVIGITGPITTKIVRMSKINYVRITKAVTVLIQAMPST